MRRLTEFHRHLKNAINERIPDKDGVRIYFDSQNFEAGHHSQGLLDAAGQAALFLAVVSPKYVAPGKFTLDELAAFCDNGQSDQAEWLVVQLSRTDGLPGGSSRLALSLAKWV